MVAAAKLELPLCAAIRLAAAVSVALVGLARTPEATKNGTSAMRAENFISLRSKAEACPFFIKHASFYTSKLLGNMRAVRQKSG